MKTTGTTTKTEYGRYVHGIPQNRGGVTWRRVDLYYSDDQQQTQGVADSMFAAAADDDSPYHSPQGAGYDASCPCCWLGFGHTENKHLASVEAARRAEREHVGRNRPAA